KQYELFEEALLIYTKCGKKSEGEERTAMHVSAAEVLVDNIKDLNRAKDFAERVADSAVWSKVRGRGREGTPPVLPSLFSFCLFYLF
ncbi:unnamed protein product, partial [Hapterophycus canaliculatus]